MDSINRIIENGQEKNLYIKEKRNCPFKTNR
ncbi:hypothetical protein HMPREF0988_02284 [Lachnospiraceae bacterium 1_4_56FAA]|nr:hypothetical protein HMPREF0988_02284 [Lachnospiraceae bacterium 1_4_56FAA]